jgi:hypothetical protein
MNHFDNSSRNGARAQFFPLQHMERLMLTAIRAV